MYIKNIFSNSRLEIRKQIKNGHVVSTSMSSQCTEVISSHRQLVFLTNREVLGYLKNLSRDRWYPMKITNDYQLI